MKIGLLGGTFDPVHNGHIVIATTVREKIGLDEVIFIPTAQTPLKDNDDISSARDRIEMVQLAIEDIPYFRLSTVEMDRPGPSFTIDTLTELRKTVGEEDEIYFIMGCDSLESFHLWKDPERLIQVCRLVAVPRPGRAVPDLDALEIKVPGLSKNVIVLDEPHIDISATDIRERVAQGLSVSRLVPAPVEEYIKKHELYV